MEFPRNLLVENYLALMREKAIYFPVAYRLLQELGRGRQGVVFLGLRQGARGCITRHAIKIFDPSVYKNTRQYWTDMGRIAIQTSVLQTVSSPHLVDRDVYEETNGIGYVQMSVVDGIPLDALLDEHMAERVRERCSAEEWDRFMQVIFRRVDGRLAIQPGVALYIMRQMLRGLETLHDMGFVHSDVKPANVMIDRLGYGKLIDYGRAVRIKERVGILFGTPLYMAPEVHHRDISMAQSDIYSTGLVGLEMLRGRPLTDPGAIDEEALLQIKRDLPGRLDRLLPGHVQKNRELCAMLRRFLDPDPSGRYQQAADAEYGSEGLRLVHDQLAIMGAGTEYGRELQEYVGKLLPEPRNREDWMGRA